MKHVSILIIFTLMSLVVGCQEKSSKKSSSSQNAYCMQYPYTAGCNYGTTVGGTNGGTCLPGSYEYSNSIACPGFCMANPSHANCVYGTTGGTTIGGITTGTTTGTPTHPYLHLYYPSVGIDLNWGVHYPGGEPVGSCAAAYAPTGIGYVPYDTRVATITATGGQDYDPTTTATQMAYNTSSILKTVTTAKNFFSTDSKLKVRFKVKPQPDAARSSGVCYGRATGQSTMPGYTKLRFSVTATGTDIYNVVKTEPVGVYTVGVNSCNSPAISLDHLTTVFPGGFYLNIKDIYANQNCWWNATNGFTSCDAFKLVASGACWSMNIEVAADGTKTFD